MKTQESRGFLALLLDKYRTRTIESINMVLDDDDHSFLHDDLRTTLDFIQNATYYDLILTLAAQQLTALKSDWDLEDELLKTAPKN